AVGSDGGHALAVVGLAVELHQRWLGVERIDLARRAVHEQEDNVLGLGSEVRLLFRAEDAVAAEKIEEGQPGEAAADLPEELAPRPATGRRVGDEARRRHLCFLKRNPRSRTALSYHQIIEVVDADAVDHASLLLAVFIPLDLTGQPHRLTAEELLAAFVV